MHSQVDDACAWVLNCVTDPTVIASDIKEGCKDFIR